jgi:hypothetical protein
MLKQVLSILLLLDLSNKFFIFEKTANIERSGVFFVGTLGDVNNKRTLNDNKNLIRTGLELPFLFSRQIILQCQCQSSIFRDPSS